MPRIGVSRDWVIAQPAADPLIARYTVALKPIAAPEASPLGTAPWPSLSAAAPFLTKLRSVRWLVHPRRTPGFQTVFFLADGPLRAGAIGPRRLNMMLGRAGMSQDGRALCVRAATRPQNARIWPQAVPPLDFGARSALYPRHVR